MKPYRGPKRKARCAASDCRKTFETRDPRRRYCTKRCGNRDRQRRFYNRHKKSVQ